MPNPAARRGRLGMWHDYLHEVEIGAVMESRWARVGRGIAAAAFATFVAALSHTLAGGSAPSLFAIVTTFVISAPICTLLAGRTLSAWRLTASVALSQSLFHGVFSALGMPVGVAHQHGAPITIPGLPESANVNGDATMWMAHAVAAAVTVVVFLHAERALRSLSGTARLFFIRLLAAVVPLPPARRPRRVAPGYRFAPINQTLLLSPMRHRGPPELVAV